MFRVEVSESYSAAMGGVFDFIADPAHWVEWHDEIIAAEPPAAWTGIGDEFPVDVDYLGHRVAAGCILEELYRPRLLRYVLVFEDLPQQPYEWHLSAGPDATEVRVAIDVPEPVSLFGPGHSPVPRGVTRNVRRTLEALGRALETHGIVDTEPGLPADWPDPTRKVREL
jgi:hypothetical protein